MEIGWEPGKPRLECFLRWSSSLAAFPRVPIPFAHALTFRLQGCHHRLHTDSIDTGETDSELRIWILARSERSILLSEQCNASHTRGSSRNRLFGGGSALWLFGRFKFNRPPVGRSFGSSSSSLFAEERWVSIQIDQTLVSHSDTTRVVPVLESSLNFHRRSFSALYRDSLVYRSPELELWRRRRSLHRYCIEEDRWPIRRDMDPTSCWMLGVDRHRSWNPTDWSHGYNARLERRGFFDVWNVSAVDLTDDPVGIAAVELVADLNEFVHLVLVRCFTMSNGMLTSHFSTLAVTLSPPTSNFLITNIFRSEFQIALIESFGVGQIDDEAEIFLDQPKRSASNFEGDSIVTCSRLTLSINMGHVHRLATSMLPLKRSSNGVLKAMNFSKSPKERRRWDISSAVYQQSASISEDSRAIEVAGPSDRIFGYSMRMRHWHTSEIMIDVVLSLHERRNTCACEKRPCSAIGGHPFIRSQRLPLPRLGGRVESLNGFFRCSWHVDKFAQYFTSRGISVSLTVVVPFVISLVKTRLHNAKFFLHVPRATICHSFCCFHTPCGCLDRSLISLLF